MVVTKASIRWYATVAIALVAAAVGLFVVLVACHLHKEALTLAGPGAIFALAVPPLTKIGSLMERLYLLQLQRKRAIQAGENAPERKRIEDAILAFSGKW
jgi:hypothetical protein